MKKADNVIVGNNAIYSTDSRETGLNNNILIVGGSGCGKTMSIVEPCLIEAFNSSLIINVTKRRLVEKYSSEFKKRGYKVYDCNFANPTKSNVAYDPMFYIKNYMDIIFLSESIVKSAEKDLSNTVDPYWNDSAIALLNSEIAYILYTSKNPTLSDVIDFHNSMDLAGSDSGVITKHDMKFKSLARKDPDNFAVTSWNVFRQLPERTARCIWGTLQTSLSRMFTPELHDMINIKQKIDIKKVAKEKSVVFISTSAVNPTLNKFVNIFFSQAFKCLFEYAEEQPNGKLPVPVRMICDDFATGGQIANFTQYISIFREKEISVTLLLQSESQLAGMYGQNDSTTIINNCDTYVYMGGMDLQTGRSISERINKPIEDILYMPIGQEYIFRRGSKPVRTTRYDISKDERYIKISQGCKENIR